MHSADVSDKNSNHDVRTLAVALVAARTGDAGYRAKAVDALTEAIGTEQGGRWLSVGRNLGAHAIATDVLGLPSSHPVSRWLAGFLEPGFTLAHNNDESEQINFRTAAWSSGSNASAQQGFAHAAVAALVGDAGELAWGWDGFRRYAGDRTSPQTLTSNDDSWQQIPADPVGVQNAGATKDGCRLDGAISNDMSRGGGFGCDPDYTQYPWVGIEGFAPAAEVFANNGCPAYTVADSAVRRAGDYLWHLRAVTGDPRWYDAARAAEVKHLLNVVYDQDRPAHMPTGPGRTVGFTDWTHPAG